MAPKLVRLIAGLIFEYDTPRLVHIKNKKVGLINRMLQLCIIGYVIGYTIVFEKGYQAYEEVKSAVTTKVKGVGFTNMTDNPGIGTRVWDVADYIIPPQENNAFFVMTNMIVTPNQTYGDCQEDPDVPDAQCTTAEDCHPGTPVEAGHGYRTGVCETSTRDPTVKVCRIHAWCPVEVDKVTDVAVLLESKDFTAFIKNSVEFPRYGVRRRNILGFKNDKDLANCRYSPTHPQNKFCPIFILGDIVRLAGADYAVLGLTGGVMQIIITWDCNLDNSEEDCVPEYQFRRLDSDYTVSKGYNFRYAQHYVEDGERRRTLIKAYGILFTVSVQGRAGKFNIVPLTMKIGNGLALLFISSIVCDIVVLYVLKARAYYRDKKYLTVTEEESHEVELGISPSKANIQFQYGRMTEASALP